MLKIISVSTKLHDCKNVCFRACAEVNEVQLQGWDIHEYINYVIKVTKSQVFAVSNKSGLTWWVYLATRVRCLSGIWNRPELPISCHVIQ